ncbi:MAG: hypothetical protein IKN89_14285 [Oscillospiraceae bacterium]|nr:hypothetical protein [Oscillospiraceae bacterium]
MVGFSRAGDLTVDYGSSQLYTQAELDEAIALIRSQFACFGGCELQSLTYAGDEANNEENLSWMNEMGNGNYTQVCEFLSSFHSPENHIVLNPDSDYTDYQWWLARTETGSWELLTWGY